MPERKAAPAPPRRRRIERAGEVPPALIAEIVEDMAWRMSETPAAQRCVGLSFSFRVVDRRLATARYQVEAGGVVVLEHGSDRRASFEFRASADDFDAVLSGAANAWAALLRRRIRMRGSLTQVRRILTMMPAVEAAYTQARAEMLDRHAHRYDFRI